MPGRLGSVARGRPLAIVVDGRRLEAFAGETVAAALLANGINAFGPELARAPHGLQCNMGMCYQCLVSIDGDAAAWTRSCLRAVADGMTIRTAAR